MTGDDVMVEFKVRPLSDLMGAEISGIDLRQKIDKGTTDKLLNAIKDHLVICIKNQKLFAKRSINCFRKHIIPRNYSRRNYRYKIPFSHIKLFFTIS